MPAASTHYIFNKELLKLLTEHSIYIENESMFHLGAQGPDLFFYDKGGFTKESLSSFGSIMHIKKIYEVVDFLYRNSADDNDLRSYFYGYLSHYSLDSTMHPFVEYYVRSAVAGTDENVAHRKIESCIDSIMLDRDNSCYDVHIHLKLNQNDCEKLAKLYSLMFHEVLGIEIEEKRIKSAISDCPKMLRFLKPSAFKRSFALFLAKFIKPLEAASANIIKFDYPFRKQIENGEEREYRNPRNGEAISGNSFFEIYDIALEKAVKLILDPLNFNHYKRDFNGN